MSDERIEDVAGVLVALAPRLATLGRGPGGAGVGREEALDRERAVVLRRGLEEGGVRCREEAGLSALEAFGVASARGVEVVVARDLSPSALALAMARSVAHLAIQPQARFAAWFQYRAGQAPTHQTADERRALGVVEAIARALLAGRLEGTPLYVRLAGRPARLGGARLGVWGGCGDALLGGLHRASNALYWRSGPYQALRASGPMIRLTAGVHALLSPPGGARAA